MFSGASGLRAVKDDDLVAMLRAVHRDELACPITQPGLAMCGLLRIADEIDVLRGLDKAGTRAVLVAVIAERRRR